MNKYEVDFLHKVDITYRGVIYANSKEEALKMFEESPFDVVEELDSYDEQGQDIKLLEICEIL